MGLPVCSWCVLGGDHTHRPRQTIANGALSRVLQRFTRKEAARRAAAAAVQQETITAAVPGTPGAAVAAPAAEDGEEVGRKLYPNACAAAMTMFMVTVSEQCWCFRVRVLIAE